MEKELVKHLLAEETPFPLEERLMRLIEEKAKDQVDLMRQRVTRRGYPDRFGSDELYLEILRELLEDWSDARIME